MAFGADTSGMEVIPFEHGAGVFDIHQILLPMGGTYILENINTAELVSGKAWQFRFVINPGRSAEMQSDAFEG